MFIPFCERMSYFAPKKLFSRSACLCSFSLSINVILAAAHFDSITKHKLGESEVKVSF